MSKITLAVWGSICLGMLGAFNLSERTLGLHAHPPPWTALERGELIGIGLAKLTCFLGAIVCFILHFTLRRPSSRPAQIHRRRPAHAPILR